MIYVICINRMLRMFEVGLLQKWKNQYQPKPYRCLLPSNGDKKEPSGSLHRLNFQNLSGAFVIIILGCVFSILSFAIENLIRRFLIKK